MKFHNNIKEETIKEHFCEKKKKVAFPGQFCSVQRRTWHGACTAVLLRDDAALVPTHLECFMIYFILFVRFNWYGRSEFNK